ncbi:MAG: hypothetical protein ACKVOT_03445 [Polaromonas sp.]
MTTTPAAAPTVAMGPLQLSFEGAQALSDADKLAMTAHAEVAAFLSADAEADAGQQAVAAFVSPLVLANNETPLPHTTQAPVSTAERVLLKAYLNHPRDATLASFLGLLSLNRSLLVGSTSAPTGDRFKHTVLAQYFLSRARDLGYNPAWQRSALTLTQQRLDQVVARQPAITVEENHAAHQYFNRTFNEREGDRYLALGQLLDDHAAAPKNMYTVFALTAINLWIGGEGDRDDPTVLHNFVVGSYFSVQAMSLAQQLEVAWTQDHTATPRFRMATILGGFSALHRRWLATVHDDQVAIAAIDNEHREWRLIQRAFHAFTVGLSFFEEKNHFLEALSAWQDSFTHCAQEPVRTCSNLPRFSHNFEGFVLGYVDFLLKAGDVESAYRYLSIRHVPEQFPPMAAYPQWDLGRAAWEYRENNAPALAARYANADPTDDPVHLMLKPRQWGGSTATCQLCHQAQGSRWTEAEKNTIVLPPEQVASVRRWPAVSTSWYGARLPAS